VVRLRPENPEMTCEQAQLLMIPRTKNEPSLTQARRRRARPMTVKESWEDLKRRSPSLDSACRRKEEKDRRRRLFWRIGTAAAALNISRIVREVITAPDAIGPEMHRRVAGVQEVAIVLVEHGAPEGLGLCRCLGNESRWL